MKRQAKRARRQGRRILHGIGNGSMGRWQRGKRKRTSGKYRSMKYGYKY